MAVPAVGEVAVPAVTAAMAEMVVFVRTVAMVVEEEAEGVKAIISILTPHIAILWDEVAALVFTDNEPMVSVLLGLPLLVMVVAPPVVGVAQVGMHEVLDHTEEVDLVGHTVGVVLLSILVLQAAAPAV